jgi:hypothetical protein
MIITWCVNASPETIRMNKKAVNVIRRVRFVGAVARAG